MQTRSNRTPTSAAFRPTTFPLEVWANDLSDFSTDDTGSFDDNWIVSAGDLFGNMELPLGLSDQDDLLSRYDVAA